MRIALAQQNYMIGDFEGNRNKIIAAINEVKNQGVDIIVFSELSVCGYPPRDFLEFDDFIEQHDNYGLDLGPLAALHCRCRRFCSGDCTLSGAVGCTWTDSWQKRVWFAEAEVPAGTPE